MFHHGSKFHRIKGYALAFAIVTVVTLLLWGIREHLDKAHLGLFYLLVVACVAAASGTGPALFASILAFLMWDFFFLPPQYTLTLSDERDWILLFTFLVIGILIGQLTGRMREREQEAIEKEQDTAALYRAILSVSADTTGAALSRITKQVVESTKALGAIIFLSSKDSSDLVVSGESGDMSSTNRKEIKRVGGWAIENAKAVGLGPPPEFSAHEENPWPISVLKDQVFQGSEDSSGIYLPLYTREKAIGVLIAFPGVNQDFTLSHRRLLVAFAAIAGTFLERRRLLDEAAQAAAARETEHLKSVLFSSLSHNLKTPLASLSATLSSLRQKDLNLGAAALDEQLGFMTEDLERITENIDKLLNLAQLEAGSSPPHLEPVELDEIIGTALRHLSETDYKRIRIQLPEELPLVPADSVQLIQVVRHLVENAVIYSPMDSPIRIGAKSDNQHLEFWIDDEGPGIPEDERENVFRKFYRGEAAMKNSVRGTGLGLSICQEIVQTHHGNIKIEKSAQGGARLSVSLPIALQRVKVKLS